MLRKLAAELSGDEMKAGDSGWAGGWDSSVTISAGGGGSEAPVTPGTSGHGRDNGHLDPDKESQGRDLHAEAPFTTEWTE